MFSFSLRMPLVIKNTFLEETERRRARVRSLSADGSLTSASQAEPRTVMLWNIPNKYSRRALEDIINSRGFIFDNLYVPFDTYNFCNLGYAFVNFKTRETAENFMKEFDGAKLPSQKSSKICRVCWANRQTFR